MANDRIRIMCKVCGEDQCLYKFYPCWRDGQGGGYVADHEILDEFFDKHIRNCHPFGYSMYLYGEPGFILYTESEADDPKIKVLSVLEAVANKAKNDKNGGAT